MKNKIFIITKTGTLFFITIFILITIIKFVFDIRFINNYVDTITGLLFLSSIITWLVIIIRKSNNLKALKIIALSSVIVVLLLLLCVNILFGSLDNHIIKTAHSPSGKNALVVFEGGFIDATYEAYPIKCNFLYQIQNNGYVSNHDDWGGSDITITWENDNKAIVKVNSDFHPNEGSNINNEIVVTFK